MSLRKQLLTALLAMGLLSAMPAVALGVPLPSATTENASEIAYDAASLHGSVIRSSIFGSRTRP